VRVHVDRETRTCRTRAWRGPFAPCPSAPFVFALTQRATEIEENMMRRRTLPSPTQQARRSQPHRCYTPTHPPTHTHRLPQALTHTHTHTHTHTCTHTYGGSSRRPCPLAPVQQAPRRTRDLLPALRERPKAPRTTSVRARPTPATHCVCVCVCERERASARARERESERESEREAGREREKARESERERVCVCLRACVYVASAIFSRTLPPQPSVKRDLI
jgi:hypothetical protein